MAATSVDPFRKKNPVMDDPLVAERGDRRILNRHFFGT